MAYIVYEVFIVLFNNLLEIDPCMFRYKYFILTPTYTHSYSLTHTHTHIHVHTPTHWHWSSRRSFSFWRWRDGSPETAAGRGRAYSHRRISAAQVKALTTPRPAQNTPTTPAPFPKDYSRMYRAKDFVLNSVYLVKTSIPSLSNFEAQEKKVGGLKKVRWGAEREREGVVEP